MTGRSLKNSVLHDNFMSSVVDIPNNLTVKKQSSWRKIKKMRSKAKREYAKILTTSQFSTAKR